MKESRPPRPVGQPTRGKTALNRLRQIDVYVALAYPGVLSGGSPLVIDLGFGAQVWTTLEMRDRWLPLNPQLHVLGIEIVAERVAAALPYADPPAIEFRLGGFNLVDLLDTQMAGQRARLIRCYNVLRQYDETAVSAAIRQMGHTLETGGLLIEGTSNPTGRIVAFDVYQKTQADLIHKGLVFGTNFQQAIEPVDFQTILPKRLIHHMLDDTPAAFFAAWRAAFLRARSLGHTGRRQAWIAAAKLLSLRYPVDLRSRLIRRGYVTLRHPLSG